MKLQFCKMSNGQSQIDTIARCKVYRSFLGHVASVTEYEWRVNESSVSNRALRMNVLICLYLMLSSLSLALTSYIRFDVEDKCNYKESKLIYLR